MMKKGTTARMFAPEQWGQVEKFSKLSTGTHNFNERSHRALKGVEAHMRKFVTLLSLAKKLAPNIKKDKEQLEKNGYTNEHHGHEVCTLIEAGILELYSSVDCVVKVLREIYGSGTRRFKDSTRKFFNDVDSLEGAFPQELKTIINEAIWFTGLLHLRDELVHLDTGRVSMDEETGVISYQHFGMKEQQKPLIREDIFMWLDNVFAAINQFLGSIFNYLNAQLNDEEVMLLCGIVDGRILLRYISPKGEIDFNSGSCGSWEWFDEEDNPSCPFKDNCGAYGRKSSLKIR